MNQHILVVEDNPDNQRLIIWVLEDAEYQVTCADTAEQGIELLEKQAFDMVLMDISLPGISGAEATEILRTKEKYQKLPILALTAHAIKGEREKILASGVNEILTKPIDEDQLLARLDKYFGH